MAIMGDDVRWVGNERGLGRETEWSATVLTPGIYARSEANNGALEISNTSDDLGSRDMLAKASELFWYPSEVDVSIRPGWFYHAEEDGKVKSLKHLTDIYFQSVGYNSVLLLNIPPDRRGLIHENDIARLKEFAAYRQKMLATDYVEDGAELWKAAEGDSREYTLKPDSKINVVLLQEDIAKGQRVEAFTVEAFVDGQWTPLCEGTTIGYKRMLRFADTEAGKLRVTIKSTRRKTNICKVAAYYAEPVEEVADRSEWNGLSRAGWKVTEKQPLVIDLGETVSLKAFTYAPLNETAKPTMAFRYKFYVSQDGKQWKEVPTNGEFSNIMHNPLPQTVAFKSVVKARYIKLDATTPSSTPAEVEMNEIGVTLAE